MIVSIAEWIGNLLVLGIAAMIWIVVVFGAMMIFAIFKKFIKEIKND
jgi:uncharacterized membrane protein